MARALAVRLGPGFLGWLAASAISGAAWAQPCTIGPLSDYLTGSCTLGDKTFSDFSFGSTAGGSGVAPSANEITVTPSITSGGPGLIFSAGTIGVTQGAPITSATFVDVILDYTVIAEAGFQIAGADLAVADGLTGAGQGSVTGFLTALPSGVPLPPLNAVLPTTTDAAVFPTSTDGVAVLDDVLVEIPAGDSGSASITSASQHFSQIPVVAVPEPTTIALFAVGMAGLGMARLGMARRRRLRIQAVRETLK